MRRFFTNAISVVCSFFRVLILKILNFKHCHISFCERFSPNVVTEFEHGADVNIGKMVRIHSGSKIKARKGAVLTIGANTKINYNCIIVCRKNISIGEGTEFGPSVYIYDHDHDFRDPKGIKGKKYFGGDVIIGKNVWIGANSIILKGSVIGDNAVIGAGSIVNCSISPNSVFVQKRDGVAKAYRNDE